MITLDASVLIAYLGPTDALHDRAVESIRQARRGTCAISPITHAEVLVGPTRVGTLDRTQVALAQLGIAAVPLPEDAAQRLAALRVATSLRLPDCCVLLAAQQRAAAILTFDARLATAAEQIGTDVRR